MKLNSIITALALASMCWGTVQARERMVVNQADAQYSIDAEAALRGADGDVDYTLEYNKAKGVYDVKFTIAADDKDSPLMRLLKGGEPVQLGTPGEVLLTANVTGIEQVRGTVIATLMTEGLTFAQVKKVLNAHGDLLLSSKQGGNAVVIASTGDCVFPALPAMVDKISAASGVLVAQTIPEQPKKDVTPEQPKKPQPKVYLASTEFSGQNENGLFKFSGTWGQSSLEPNGRLLTVQESLMRTKECKTAAMNLSTGGLYIYSSNGYATTARLPKALVETLRYLNVPHTNVNEVVLTESNKWIIVYEKSGYKTSAGLPKALLERMQQCNTAKQNFKSITLTDDGSWAVVTNKGYWSEGDELTEFLAQAQKKYGGIQSIHRTCNGAMVAVCKRGVYCHNVPQSMVTELKTLEFEPRMIEFTDDGLYIITDGKSKVVHCL